MSETVCFVCIGDHSWSSFWFSNKQHYLSRVSVLSTFLDLIGGFTLPIASHKTLFVRTVISCLPTKKCHVTMVSTACTHIQDLFCTSIVCSVIRNLCLLLLHMPRENLPSPASTEAPLLSTLQQVCTWQCSQPSALIDWCCFYYFLRNSLVALLEALFARNFLDLRYRCAEFLFFFARPFSYKIPSSASPDQAPVPGCRHSSCVLIIHVCLCVRASICACENV